MANRIPPSLKWLIDKRARIAGEIAKTKRSLKTIQVLIKDLEDLEFKLQSIDATLELHDIKVDVDLIGNIETKHLRLNIPHGELTRSILTCIRIYGENGPVSKVRIVDFIIARHFDGNAEEITHAQIAKSVQIRLKCLHRAGRLNRHHSAITSEFGLWSLPDLC